MGSRVTGMRRVPSRRNAGRGYAAARPGHLRQSVTLPVHRAEDSPGANVHRTSSRSLKLLSLALVAVLTLVAAGCGGDDDAATTTTKATGSSGDSDVTKAAWVYVGPTNDGGWTQAHD